MFRRKLTALDHPDPNGLNATDEEQFRKLMVWLEDQKIRHYKIEDRTALRNVCAGNWNDALKKYLEDISCPLRAHNRNELVDWLLGYAVRLEYGDNTDKYRTASNNVKSHTKSGNPLDLIDFNDADSKAGILSLAAILELPPHPDHIVQLKAISILVREKLSKDAIASVQKNGIPKPNTIPIEKLSLGFETSDYISQEAAKVLRLLYIRELRDLQNSANEAVVAVQTLTADPKTDTKLGKVGRG
ncbi:hypothetical protein CAPTEDRAFT_172911 [Capitella teleta]|uniref:RNA transcription, translation and transport factor protein n=1 Tax=Capitella teleta TaxID=283909 RepID=R7VLV1_CAPTE|nr:hypothetical protein CAPTEDRAFT_172911 [Capitella teleta]|eukprot:ELU17935.1 hypothetical protein CAPTEDRAFT_172911 [Capitella teleta]